MNGSVLVNLKQEFPTLLATAAGLNKDADPFQWWKNHSNDLPYWFAAAKKTIHVQSSSAAAERFLATSEFIWLLLRYASLAGYVQASLMLQYNKRYVID